MRDRRVLAFIVPKWMIYFSWSWEVEDEAYVFYGLNVEIIILNRDSKEWQCEGSVIIASRWLAVEA
jgi:hypothetical protein